MEIVASWPSQMPLAAVPGWARRVEDLGFDVVHVPETVHDPFVVSAMMVANTRKLVVRTSMVVAFPRSPMITAISAWDLATLSGGRFQLGVASQVRGNIVGRFSTEWSEPVSRLRDYITSLRAIFDAFQTGAELDHVGPHYSFERLQPYFNPGPIDHSAPQIWSGGVNPGMCALAGELSDGFVCHPTSSHPRLLRASILPAISRGAAKSVRTDTGPRIVVGPQPLVAPTRPDLAAARETRRTEMAFLYSTPAYRPQLEEFGLEDLGRALSEMAKRSDWDDLAKQLTNDVLDLLIPSGTYAELPGVLEQWYSGLCHGIVLAVPEDTAHDADLRQMLRHCQKIPTA